jgi:hypothetical protein
MQSTHVQTLEVIGGVPSPLRMRFSPFYCWAPTLTGAGSPFKVEFSEIVKEFNLIGDYILKPVRPVYEYPLRALHVPEVNDEVERKLPSISKDCYQTVVPRLVESLSSRFESPAIFFTDGSKGEAGTGFGVLKPLKIFKNVVMFTTRDPPINGSYRKNTK